MEIILTCDSCGKSFLKKRSAVRPNQRTFCSRECHRSGQYKDGLNSAGYKIIRVDGKQVYEHRWLMERHLGRKLLRHEHVHHINGNKSDNNLSNLTVMDESKHHQEHVGPAFDVKRAKRLYDKGIGYRKLSQLFGVARQNIRACFVQRGWHIDGRTRTTIKRDHFL